MEQILIKTSTVVARHRIEDVPYLEVDTYIKSLVRDIATEIKEILEKLLAKIPNLEFQIKLRTMALTDMNQDYVLEGLVQVGKTDSVLISSWIAKYVHNYVPIIVAWDKIGVLNQWLARTDKFNRQDIVKPEYWLKAKEILPNSTPGQMAKDMVNHIFYTILTGARLKVMLQLIQSFIASVPRNRKILLIFDEADQMVKDNATVISGLMKKLYTSYHQHINFVYVGATNFAVYNSIKFDRKFEIIRIPTDLYVGYVYRCYQDFEHVVVNGLNKLKHPDIMIEEDWTDIYEILGHLNTTTQLQQPNIGLLNVVHNNTFKANIALKVSQQLKQLHIITYTGEGADHYYQGVAKSRLGKKGDCMQTILQLIKDKKLNSVTTRRLGLNITRHQPILIIATGMANRAQTFKSSDNLWILTHFFLSISKTSGMDTIVQSQRCNGQYHPDQPVAKIFASAKIHCYLQLSNYNTTELAQEAYNHQDRVMAKEITMRALIIQPSYAKPRGKYIKWSSRKGVDDTRGDPLKEDHGIDGKYKTLEQCEVNAEKARYSNNCTDKVFVTYKVDLPVAEYIALTQRYTEPRYKCKNGKTPYQQFQTLNPYLDLSPAFQNVFRSWIVQSLIQLQLPEDFAVRANESCQLAYTVARCEQLNRLEQKKNTDQTFSARILALNPSNKATIPVVIYHQRYFNSPSEYNNQVLMWHRTNNTYCFYVNVDDAARTKLISYGQYIR